jgi:hypothetical protein
LLVSSNSPPRMNSSRMRYTCRTQIQDTRNTVCTQSVYSVCVLSLYTQSVYSVCISCISVQTVQTVYPVQTKYRLIYVPQRNCTPDAVKANK